MRRFPTHYLEDIRTEIGLLTTTGSRYYWYGTFNRASAEVCKFDVVVLVEEYIVSADVGLKNPFAIFFKAFGSLKGPT